MNYDEKLNADELFLYYNGKSISQKDFKQAEKKASNLRDKTIEFRMLLTIFKDVRNGSYNISLKNLSIISAAILYVVSPIDAIPDLIPFFGWTDDIAVVGFAMKHLSEVLFDYKQVKKF